MSEHGFCQVCLAELTARFAIWRGVRICHQCNKMNDAQLNLARQLADQFNPVFMLDTLKNRNFIRAATRNYKPQEKKQ